MNLEEKPLTQNVADVALGVTHQAILLDIDGTLNESQQIISDGMLRALHRLTRQVSVYFVTGNPYTKSVDIINGPIKDFSGIFCNNADELRSMRGKLIWGDKETPPLPQMQHFISVHLGPQANNSIDWRTPRMVNVSTVGRFATFCERKNHDASWREYFINCLKDAFPQIECSIGGSVSVDIYSKGADKSRAAKYINAQGKKFVYIGDKDQPTGNDYPVKVYCELHPENLFLTTKGPAHTIEMLETFLE